MFIVTGKDSERFQTREKDEGEVYRTFITWYENVHFCVVLILFNEHLTFFKIKYEDRLIHPKCSLFCFSMWTFSGQVCLAICPKLMIRKIKSVCITFFSLKYFPILQRKPEAPIKQLTFQQIFKFTSFHIHLCIICYRYCQALYMRLAP